MVKAAGDYISEKDDKTTLIWNLLIMVALQTGMRRGELLNLCWSDIDFDEYAIDITPKDDTEETWEWEIKDHEERTGPLSENTTQLLIDIQCLFYINVILKVELNQNYFRNNTEYANLNSDYE